MALGLWTSPALAQKKSVAEEILDILRAENKISEEKYRELLNKAKAETEAREAGVEAFRRDSVKDVKKSVDWLDRVTFFGDMRARLEGFYQDGGPNGNARTRERIRLRFGARIRISDELEGGIRLASGNANDPISTNQTLENVFTRKPISLDQAYITVTPGATFGLGDWPWKPISITAGKFANPLFKPRAGMVSEMIFDDDLTPEGTSETFTFYQASEGVLRRFQLIAIQWMADEASRSAESFVLGGQVVANLKILPTTTLTLGLGDYYFSHKDRFAQERNSNSDLKVTNCVKLKDGSIVKGGFSISPSSSNPIVDFCGGFNIFNVSAQVEFDTGYPRWPLGLFVDFAQNTDAEGNDDTAVWAGAGIGTLKNPGDWQFSVAWGRVETESVLSELSYSDFGRDGGTNVQGPFVRIDYLLLPRLTLTAKNHFVSFIDRPAGQSNATVNRFQLDAVLAF
jgi:hypothetical protein